MQQGRRKRPWTGWPSSLVYQAGLERRCGVVRIEVGTGVGALAGHALEAGMLVVLGPGLVFENLAIELVDQEVDGGVQVLREAGHMHVLAAQSERNLGALAFLFFGEVIDSQDDCDIDDMIKMAPDALQFALQVFTYCGSHFEMMSTDGEIHTTLL